MESGQSELDTTKVYCTNWDYLVSMWNYMYEVKKGKKLILDLWLVRTRVILLYTPPHHPSLL